jgi:hypothetical protein
MAIDPFGCHRPSRIEPAGIATDGTPACGSAAARCRPPAKTLQPESVVHVRPVHTAVVVLFRHWEQIVLPDQLQPGWICGTWSHKVRRADPEIAVIILDHLITEIELSGLSQ